MTEDLGTSSAHVVTADADGCSIPSLDFSVLEPWN